MLALAPTAVAGACGGPGQTASPATGRTLTGESGLATSSEGGEDDEAPRIVIAGLTLPEPPVSVDTDDPDLEPVVNESRAMLARAVPTPDEGLPVSEMRAFVEGPLVTWLGEQARSIRLAWTAVQRIDGSEIGAHVVGRAIVGVTLLELASRVARLPLPRAVREDAAARLAIRDALVSAARPLLERATQALGACASAAVGASDPTVDEWRVFCDAEIERAHRAPRSFEEPGLTEPEGSPSRAQPAPPPA
ncbi:MAG: hypothetical protein OHK0013_21840 [Sandaracinaceae bacterium]